MELHVTSFDKCVYETHVFVFVIIFFVNQTKES